MGRGIEKTFFVQAWMTRAAYTLGALQFGFATVLFLLADVLDVGPVLPVVFVVGGALTAYQGFWTARTPIARIDDARIVLRMAMLARPVEIRFADVRAYARIPPGWLVLISADGTETRVPLTALSDADADALVHALAEHLTEVSYADGAG